MRYKLILEIESAKELEDIEKELTDYISNNIGTFIKGEGEIIDYVQRRRNKFNKNYPLCANEKIPRCIYLTEDNSCKLGGICCVR